MATDEKIIRLQTKVDREIAGAEPTGATLPTVELRVGELHLSRERLAAVLRQADHGMMLHGKRIVRAELIEREAIGGGTTRSLELREVSGSEFIAACGTVARFIKRGPHGEPRPCDCTGALASSLYDSPPADLLARVERLAETPLLLPDNKIGRAHV